MLFSRQWDLLANIGGCDLHKVDCLPRGSCDLTDNPSPMSAIGLTCEEWLQYELITPQ